MTKKISSNLIKLISILNDGQYHDGTYIGAQLGMTRSAVWKAIKKLLAYGIQIDSIKGKGYALREPLQLLDADLIQEKLQDSAIRVLVFESLPSTNSYLKALKPSAPITICLAEQQTQGKGRLNRNWHSPFARNIYLSCFYRFQKDLSELAGLSLVTSLAITKALRICGIHEHLNVKWPNDIVYAGKKLSGNLIEVQAESHGNTEAIIGIGINVNMLNAQEEISQPWTSIQAITGKYIDRNVLCAHLINTICEYLQKFTAFSFSEFVDEWIQTDCLTQQFITVNNLDEKIHGKVTGINAQGHLLLQLANGSTRAFSSGDTSVVKNKLFD